MFISNKLSHILLVSFAFVFASDLYAKPVSPLHEHSDWTILVYVNGKNNLESAALTDFYEMAEVGSTKNINVVVQLGRPTHHHTDADGNWSGVYRFQVKKDMKPRPEYAMVDLKSSGLNTDMADPSTLEEFARWGIEKFPAKHRILVIWNHGQGWRFQLAADSNLKAIGAKQRSSNQEMQQLLGVNAPIGSMGGYRAVSTDDDTGGILFNRQIQDVLEKLAREGRKFDIVGFDACLMSMLETAYALRTTTDYMVASQELEPNNGWNYRDILLQLSKKRTITPLEFSKLLVNSYEAQYGNSDRTTLAAINMHQVSPLAESLSSLATELLASFQSQQYNIGQAREGIRSFGDWNSPPLLTSIDLEMFLTLLRNNNSNEIVKTKIDNVLKNLKKSVVSLYKSKLITDDGYGGNGLAIYFPRDKNSFIEDPYSDGYLATNEKFPLEFVTSPKTNGWPKLIINFLQVH